MDVFMITLYFECNTAILYHTKYIKKFWIRFYYM